METAGKCRSPGTNGTDPRSRRFELRRRHHYVKQSDESKGNIKQTMSLNTLSGRFALLTGIFVLLAELLILLPSISNYRLDFLESRLERAQIASLALLATDESLASDLESELLGECRRLQRRAAAQRCAPAGAVLADSGADLGHL
jgi:hypothetical protein